MEAFLTAPMEGTIRQLRGVENVISNSTEERAAIQVVLARDTDTDFARLELKERLSTLEEELPADVGPIEVEPYIPDEFLEHHSPFLSYRFIGPYASEALFRHADEVVRPELERLEGVGQVRLTGDTRRVVEIRIDEERLAAFGLDSRRVRRSIAGLDLVREAGVVPRRWKAVSA